MLKAAIYDPYLDTLGGGERYALTVAEILIKSGYDTDIFWNGDKTILTKASDRFSLEIDKINIVPDIFNIKPTQIDLPDSLNLSSNNFFNKPISFFSKFNILRQYDLIFFVSDGSLPFLFTKNNFIHFQVPFTKTITLKDKTLNFIKLKLINKVICNSKFTKNFIDQNYSVKSLILYPPVDVGKFSTSKKENIILSVGRFDNVLNAKKQDVLIDAFKKISKSIPNWKLTLAGGSLQDPEHNKYLQHLIFQSRGYPINFIINPKFDSLKELYAKSKIYWHAAGYGVNQKIHPEETEHFGMTVVESMASGLVPLVVNRGGLPEIVSNNKNGYIWDDIKTLTDKTVFLIKNPNVFIKLSKTAKTDSDTFSKEQFQINFLKLLNTKK